MDLHSNGCLGLALALCFVAVACAAPAIPDGTAADDVNGADSATANKKTPAKKTPAKSDPASSNGDTSTGSGTPAPAPPTTPTTPTTPAPTTNCAGQAPDACFDCCNQASGGTLAPADNIFGQCACGTAGQCTAVCDANFCSGTAADAACSSCLSATCDPAETAACTSASCKAGLQCAQTCN
jgi:hypothetical protein